MELFQEILHNLPFEDIIVIGKCNTRTRIAFKAVMRLPFNATIQPYVGTGIGRFCKTLREVGGFTWGSSALWTIAQPVSWFPKDLNILTPFGAAEIMVAFFVGQGFWVESVISKPSPSKITARHSVAHTLLKHITSNKQVTITESSSLSVFPALLSTFDTLRCILASPDGIICFYPRQILSGLRICNRLKSTVRAADTPARLGYHSITSTVGWDSPCGVCCPVLVRRVCGLKGSAYLDWNIGVVIGGKDRMLEIAALNHYKWSLGGRCLNENCPFYRKS
jgi:hypothetical protein